MKIEPHTLKSLAQQLERADKATIQKNTGYSRVTIDNAFKGDAITPAVRAIAAEAAKIIKKRRAEAEAINEAVK